MVIFVTEVRIIRVNHYLIVIFVTEVRIIRVNHYLIVIFVTEVVTVNQSCCSDICNRSTVNEGFTTIMLL